MGVFSNFAEAYPGLSADQLGALIVLAAFGLAAFAIYAVFQIARERKK